MRSSLPTPNTVLRLDESKQYATYVNYGVELSYAQIEDDVVYRLSPPTGCKDYLTDALAWNDENYPADKIGEGNYKFFADYDKENTTLLIGEDLTKRIHILNEYEDSIGVGLTKCFRVRDETYSGYSAVSGDPWWMTTTIHFSMFMSLCRYIMPGGAEDLTFMADNLNTGRDSYVRPIWNRLRILPQALKKLHTITRKRNSPTIELQHSMNGHYCFLTNSAMRGQLTYGPQMCEVAPELFMTPLKKGTE